MGISCYLMALTRLYMQLRSGQSFTLEGSWSHPHLTYLGSASGNTPIFFWTQQECVIKIPFLLVTHSLSRCKYISTAKLTTELVFAPFSLLAICSILEISILYSNKPFVEIQPALTFTEWPTDCRLIHYSWFSALLSLTGQLGSFTPRNKQSSLGYL